MFAVVGLSACCNITMNFVCAFMCSLSIKSGADTWRQSQKLKTGTKMATFSSFQKHVNPQRTPTQQHQKANNRYMLGPLWIHQNKDDVFWVFLCCYRFNKTRCYCLFKLQVNSCLHPNDHITWLVDLLSITNLGCTTHCNQHL